jgi:histone deacetylase complex regulatory component SIN3
VLLIVLLLLLLLQFFEKVKARLRNRELYQDFLKCLNLYAQEIISRQELINLAHVSSSSSGI